MINGESDERMEFPVVKLTKGYEQWRVKKAYIARNECFFETPSFGFAKASWV